MPELTEPIDRAFDAGDLPTVATTTLALLEAVRAGSAELDATAHPLGFIHTLLAERSDGTRLRLHLWPEEPFEPQSPTWLIHRHAWPLRSIVVQGKICDRRYRVIDAVDGAQQLYETAYEGDHSALQPSDRTVNCELLASAVKEQGSLYAVEHDAFHASEALEPSVTVAESGRPSTTPPLVVGDRGKGAVTYQRRLLSTSELRRLVGQIIG